MKLPNAGVIVDLNVVADGPTQSLVISNYDPKASFYKLSASNTASTTSMNNSDKFKAEEEDSDIQTQILFKFQGIGISLINSRLQELCYITARGIEIRLNDSDLYQTASWKLKWLQIDNQLFGGIYPIVLYPTVVPQSIKEMNNHPAFSGSISKVKDDSHGVTYIKYATILLQEMSLEIDEDFLFALLDFSKFPGASWNQQVEDKLCDETVALPEPRKVTSDGDVYFEVLHLQPTQLNLSFVRTERINVEDKVTSQNAVMFFLNILTMAIGNINDAPIRMNSLLIENVRVPIPTLMQNIQTHYGQNFFYQIHNVLGSADFLGNPVGLFNNVSSGVMDFFYEPYQGLVMNDRPQELGITVAKGGLSFLKKSVFGFSDSFAKFTGSIAKGLTVATLDKDFQNRRRMNQRRNRPKHALYGFSNGASSFVDGITSGISGVAISPMQGASKGGAQGFIKGIGKGLIGLPTKTAIGLFDLANQVSEGIRNTTLAFDGDGLDKVRLPRFIDHNGIIKPYNERESQGQYWLKTASGGEFIDDDYLAHVVLPGEEMDAVITFRRIILVSTSSNEVKWSVEFERIKSITQEKTGIKIGLANSRQNQFIPVPDANSRKFLYKKIGIAVNEFNKKCQVVL
jgi:vacuolar protein sorting-associated protein 13A/C